MTSDDAYKDALRKAAGIPTTAERQQRQEELARQQKALAEDQPRRQALVAEFKTRVTPIISQALEAAHAVLSESPSRFNLTEVHHMGVVPDLLACRSFLLTPKNQTLVVGQQAHRPLGQLEFALDVEGAMIIRVPSGTPGAPNVARKLSMGTPELNEAIRGAFVDYLKLLTNR